MADPADEALLAGVGPQVPLQLVEVRLLTVHLPSARDVAAVQALATQSRPGWPQPLCLLAVGAVAGGAARVAAGGGTRGAPSGADGPAFSMELPAPTSGDGAESW